MKSWEKETYQKYCRYYSPPHDIFICFSILKVVRTSFKFYGGFFSQLVCVVPVGCQLVFLYRGCVCLSLCCCTCSFPIQQADKMSCLVMQSVFFRIGWYYKRFRDLITLVGANRSPTFVFLCFRLCWMFRCFAFVDVVCKVGECTYDSCKYFLVLTNLLPN